jgi:hypothetical protein
MAITIDTIGACLRYNYVVNGFCGCGRQKPVDLLAIALDRGLDYPLSKVWHNVRCKCGRRPNLQLGLEWESGRGHLHGN